MAAGLYIVLSACIMKKEVMSPETTLFEKKWNLDKIHDPAGTTDVSSKAFIRFHKDKMSAGGNGSCNSFGSTLTVKGETISFRDIFSTKMYCESVQQIENSFLTGLEKISRYEIKNNKLFLYEGSTLLFEFSGENVEVS
jgi:heat shock protein HslJ